MDGLTFEERERLEREVLPAVIEDPEYAAATIVRLDRLRAENEEQARLLGMSGEREAKLLAEIDRISNSVELHRVTIEWLQKYQQVIDEALIVRHLGIAKGNPREELDAIINYDIELREELRGEEK